MSNIVPKSNFQLRNLFSPRSPLEFLALALVTTLINLVAAGNPLGFIGVFGVAMLFWWVNLKLKSSVTLSPKKQPPEGAKGLILLLSPYSPFHKDLKNPKVLNPLIEKICTTAPEQLTLADFEAISLFNSNLLPQIKAVEYHYGKNKLKDIWLISSQSYETDTGMRKGSEVTAEILEKYLLFHYPKAKFEIHRQGLTVDPSDYQQLSEIVESLFRSSGYKNEVIIADITGGTKMMSVALAMACVPPKRRMQYMDSERDWQGNPLAENDILPVVIDVDPILYNEID